MSEYTKQITVHLNYLVQEKLDNTTDLNAYADKVLSDYFGIPYDEAYSNCTGPNKWTIE
jgi:hypothetical protein